MVGALLLIVLGVVMLLTTLNVITIDSGIVFGILFLAGGAAFLAILVGNPRLNWWAVIPGLVLAAIGIIILFGDRMGNWAGSLMLIAIAMAFFVVYFMNRTFWWALIPAGILTTLAILIGVEDVVHMPDTLFPGLMFLGFGATFLALYFLPTSVGRLRWAIWPAGVMLIMGFIMSLTTTSALNLVWAVALILGGGYLIYRSVAKPRG
jgi:hypothetical protein